MSSLSHNEQEALGTLQKITAELCVPMILIGAEARLLLVDQRLTGKPLRSTKDWDFAVRVQSWSDFTIQPEAGCADHRSELQE